VVAAVLLASANVCQGLPLPAGLLGPIAKGIANIAYKNWFMAHGPFPCPEGMYSPIPGKMSIAMALGKEKRDCIPLPKEVRQWGEEAEGPSTTATDPYDPLGNAPDAYW
jgi:hypothetical protein